MNPATTVPEAEAQLLAQRLQLYPALRASVERMLQIVENQRGDAFLADDAEELVVQEMRRYGQEALQTWAERRKQGTVGGILDINFQPVLMEVRQHRCF